MVNSHASRHVPASKRSICFQARRIVSCTRSSAEVPLWVSATAKARNLGGAFRIPSLTSGLGVTELSSGLAWRCKRQRENPSQERPAEVAGCGGVKLRRPRILRLWGQQPDEWDEAGGSVCAGSPRLPCRG